MFRVEMKAPLPELIKQAPAGSVDSPSSDSSPLHTHAWKHQAKSTQVWSHAVMQS